MDETTSAKSGVTLRVENALSLRPPSVGEPELIGREAVSPPTVEKPLNRGNHLSDLGQLLHPHIGSAQNIMWFTN